jgi:hypothetical protein
MLLCSLQDVCCSGCYVVWHRTCAADVLLGSWCKQQYMAFSGVVSLVPVVSICWCAWRFECWALARHNHCGSTTWPDTIVVVLAWLAPTSQLAWPPVVSPAGLGTATTHVLGSFTTLRPFSFLSTHVTTCLLLTQTLPHPPSTHTLSLALRYCRAPAEDPGCGRTRHLHQDRCRL